MTTLAARLSRGLRWLRNPALAPAYATDPSSPREPETNRDSWCLLTPSIDVGDTDVTVRLRIPAPHTEHAHTAIRGRTLGLEVLRSGDDPDSAEAVRFFRRAIYLPVPVAGECSHSFDGAVLLVVIPRETRISDVTPAVNDHQTPIHLPAIGEPIARRGKAAAEQTQPRRKSPLASTARDPATDSTQTRSV